MLACIACSKPELEEGVGGDGTARGGTPRSKDAVKSLTSQIKDMVLKFSGSYRQCKGGGGGPHRHKSHHHHHRSAYLSHDEDDAASDGGDHCAYLTAASSNSTPAWDFTNLGGTSDSRFNRAKWIPGIGLPPEEDVVLEEDNGEPKEWMAQVEPGVHITFVSLPGGAGNDLKRIRFSREMFNKWQAQRWWGENYDRIMELYNVQRFSSQALPTPPRSDDGQRESFYSRTGSTRESPATPPLAKDRSSFRPYSTAAAAPSGRGASPYYLPSVPDPSEHILPYHLNPTAATVSAAAGCTKGEASSMFDAASRTTTSSRDEAASISISNASDLEMTEWVEQDEPGVYITIRELSEGTRELRRVRFSRERFGEVHAKLWWEENRERIQAQYL